jgi:hypothetical protein
MALIPDDVVRRLHDLKVFTVETLAKLCRCSPRTAWRRRRDLNAIASYNHNAKYHTLPDIPRFDDNGIWRYKDIGFSRFGNLTRTVQHLVGTAPEGLTAQQLCALLGVSAPSLYTFFRSLPGIVHQHMGRTLVFFSAQEQIKARQMVCHCDRAFPLRSIDAVDVLADRIRHPDDSIEQTARRLRARNAAITPEAIRMLLARHGIVKKTAVES